MAKFHESITDDLLIDAVRADDNIGFCIHCGNEQSNCEPGARRYACENCKLLGVYGAEQLLFMIESR
jgi:hypothetical protein